MPRKPEPKPTKKAKKPSKMTPEEYAAYVEEQRGMGNPHFSPVAEIFAPFELEGKRT